MKIERTGGDRTGGEALKAVFDHAVKAAEAHKEPDLTEGTFSARELAAAAKGFYLLHRTCVEAAKVMALRESAN